MDINPSSISPSTSSRLLPSTSTANGPSPNVIRSISNRSLFRETSGKSTIGLARSRQNTAASSVMSEGEETGRNLASDYQEIQKRTLTKWVNAQLAKIGDHIEDLETDLRDGKRLLALLSIVSGKSAPKPERGNMRIHQISNVARALGFLEDQLGRDALPDIGNEAIVNGDSKKTVALIFFIMLKYQIQLALDSDLFESTEYTDNPIDPSSSKSTSASPLPAALPENNVLSLSVGRRSPHERTVTDKAHSTNDAKLALLRWVRLQLADYVAANIIPLVQDFSRSWRSGVAFCLLIHHHDPDLIPNLFPVYLKEPLSEKLTWHRLLTIAFSLAYEHMGIQRYLEPEDLTDVDYPHEPSVMMYVSEYYSIMSASRHKETATSSAAKAEKRRVALERFINELGDNVNTDGRITFSASTQPPELSPIPDADQVSFSNGNSAAASEDTPISSSSSSEDAPESPNIIAQDPVKQEQHDIPSTVLAVQEALDAFISENNAAMDRIDNDDTLSTEAIHQHIQHLSTIAQHADNQTMWKQIQNIKETKHTPNPSADIPQTKYKPYEGYDEIAMKWRLFVDRLEASKTRLEDMQKDLADNAETVRAFKALAASVDNELRSLKQALNDAYPITEIENEDGVLITIKLHSLNATQEDADTYKLAVNAVSERLDVLHDTTWKEFDEQTNQLNASTLRLVSSLHGRLLQQHNDVLALLKFTQTDCHRYQRGIGLASITRAIIEELGMVQKVMDDKNREVTDTDIADLEQRVDTVRSTIYALREEYSDLLDSEPEDEVFEKHLQMVQTKYEMVRDWVDQVRIWFIEAERIRGWIGERIRLIEERNKANATLDPLSKDIPMEDEEIKQLQEEHEKLRREVEQFNRDDMDRLRTHVKMLTGTQREKDLSPADTSTIEITLTTINLLDQLMGLLRERSSLIDLLVLRVKWENQFLNAVNWIASTDKEIDIFLQQKSRWSEKQTNSIEDIVTSLVMLERQIATFDQGDYSEVLDAYQEMEDMQGGNLPDHLEQRESGFETAFEDLMKRCNFCRSVVEQHLILIDIAGQFNQLRDSGEQLRNSMIQSNAQETVPSSRGEAHYAEQIQSFKDNSAYFISSVASRITYPEPPHMSTAIGGNDAHDSQIANESIRSTLSAYAMTLALIADGLDQLLLSRQQASSLQQRASQAYDELTRVTAWMEERARALSKSRATQSGEGQIIEEEEYNRLVKERDGIASRLNQIEHEDLANLIRDVQQLEDDCDASNIVSIDRGSLVNGIENLEQAHQQLQHLLDKRSTELDVMKTEIFWQSQSTKTNQWILATGRKLWDFIVKRARYDPGREDVDKPSYVNDNENAQMLQALQDRVSEIGDRHITPLLESYHDLGEYYGAAGYPEHIERRQTEVEQKYVDLKRLATFATALLTQRATLIEFLMRSQDAQREGERIRDGITKVTRRIMEDQETNTLEHRAAAFNEEVANIWKECGLNMPYPSYREGSLLRSLQPTETTQYNNQVKAQIKALLDRKMDELHSLQKNINQLLEAYHSANEMKRTISQYDNEVTELQQWIDQQSAALKQRHVDVAVESSSFSAMTAEYIQDLQYQQSNLLSHLKEFEEGKLQPLHDRFAALVETTMKTLASQSVDISGTAHRLGEVMSDLAELKQNLMDHAVTLEAANKRMIWEQLLQDGQSQLSAMHDKLRQFVSHKNKILSQEDIEQDDLSVLEQEWAELNQQKDDFADHIMPSIQSAYEEFIDYFPMLSRPVATPDHIEAGMESLARASNRLQEGLTARSKELDLIRDRISLSHKIKHAMEWLSEQETVLEMFIQNDARWHPNVDIHQDDEGRLRTVLANHSDDFNNFTANTIGPLEQQASAFQEAAAMHNSLPIAEALNKKMQALAATQSQAVKYLQFANEVVTQRCLVVAFLLRVIQLEQSADLIREEFMSSDKQEEHNPQNSIRLEQFKMGIDDLRDHLAASIPYPVRSENVSVQTRIKDETTNNVIREMVDIRNARLSELYNNLYQLLDSKEGVSRRKMALDNYLQEAETCGNWITLREKSLDNVQNAEGNVIQLSDMLSQTESLEAAMKASGNPLATLCLAYEKCIAAFANAVDNENHDDRRFNTVKPTQQRLSEAWEKLLQEVGSTRNMLESKLLVADITEKMENLLSTLGRLQTDIGSADAATVTDDQLSRWQSQMDTLESDSYRELQTALEKQPSDIVEQMRVPMENASELMVANRAMIAQLYDALTTYRLKTTYIENAETVQAHIDNVQKAIHETRIQYNSVPADKSERTSKHDALLIAQKTASEQQNNCQEAYNDLLAYFKFICLQSDDLKQDIQQVQDDTTRAWQALQVTSTQLSSLVNRNAKWQDHYDILAVLSTDLDLLQTEIDKSEGVKHALDDLERKCNALSDKARHLLSETKEMHDSDNLNVFMAEYATVAAKLDKVETFVADARRMYHKKQLQDQTESLAERLRTTCEELLLQLDSAYNGVPPETAQQNAQHIDSVVQIHKRTVDSLGVSFGQCKEDIGATLFANIQRLVEEWHCDRDAMDQLKQSTSQQIEKVASVLATHDHLNRHLKGCGKHAQAQQNILTDIGNLKTRISEASANYAAIENGSILTDLDANLESIQDTLHGLNEMSLELKNQIGDSSSEVRLSAILDAISLRDDDVQKRFQETKQQLEETRMKIQDALKYRMATMRVSETIRYVDNLKDRVGALKPIPGKSTAAVERQELKEIEHDVQQLTFDELDALISDTVADDALQQQRQTLSERTRELRRLIEERQKEAQFQGNITAFTRIIEELTLKTTQLNTAIDDAAPHHAGVTNNKFNKSDLQTLLRALVSAYKQFEPVITQLIKEAQAEAAKLDDNDNRVTAMLTQAVDQWRKVKAAAAARERELQTCINQLDHEFFTKLAMAKSKSKHHSREVKRPPPFPTSQPMTRQPSSQSSTASNTSQSVKRRTGLSARPPKTSRPPSRSTSSQRGNNYVADPKNELDMELGRIVNEVQYRVKVKMVPGEVGKYWFGDENPRLVYCRILPSKLVMVRVGGGWVELSKFLRDHNLIDGGIVSAPRGETQPQATTSNNLLSDSRLQSAYLQTTRCVSPSGRVTIRGGSNPAVTVTSTSNSSTSLAVPPTRSSSKSTSSRRSSNITQSRGYVEGDKYIRVDEAGNQVMVKMTKADDGAKMPLVSRRRA